MRQVFVFFFIVSIILLGGCSRSFFMEVTGGIDTGVRFCFSEDRESNEYDEMRLRRLVVVMHDGDEWKIVWRMVGDFSARCVEYGMKLDGAKVTVPAKPLKVSRDYEVYAADRSGVIGYASSEFRIDENGLVIEADIPE